MARRSTPAFGRALHFGVLCSVLAGLTADARPAAAERLYIEWVQAGRRDKAPSINGRLRESQQLRNEARKLYERLLTEHPQYPRNDEVLFNLAYLLYADGDLQKAVRHYWRLIKQFPDSSFVAESYLLLGEHFFVNDQIGRAAHAFALAGKSGHPQVRRYALYKLAWCDYANQAYTSGIEKLMAVVDGARDASDPSAEELRAVALGDLARFFSEVDDVPKALAYFNRQGEQEAHTYGSRLGALLFGHGKWPLAIATYRKLIERSPMATEGPYFQVKIIRAFNSMGETADVRREVRRLVDVYGADTPWRTHHLRRGPPDKPVAYADNVMEGEIRDLAAEYHRAALRRRDKMNCTMARDLYAIYLGEFPKTQSAYEIRFFYAQTLYSLRQWSAAAEQFQRVSTSRPTDGRTDRYGEEAIRMSAAARAKLQRSTPAPSLRK